MTTTNRHGRQLDVDYGALVSELEILRVIIHRNKNQHRQAKWWGYLSRMHRMLKQLLLAPDGTRAQLRKRRRQKRKRQLQQLQSEQQQQQQQGRGAEGDTVESSLAGLDLSRQFRYGRIERAETLVSRILPKAHNAFERLIAQGQYVQLGLVLLACTARLWSLLRADRRVFPSAKDVQVKSEIGEVIRRHHEPVVDDKLYGADVGQDQEDGTTAGGGAAYAEDVMLLDDDDLSGDDGSITGPSPTPAPRKHKDQSQISSRNDGDDGKDELRFF